MRDTCATADVTDILLRVVALLGGRAPPADELAYCAAAMLVVVGLERAECSPDAIFHGFKLCKPCVGLLFQEKRQPSQGK